MMRYHRRTVIILGVVGLSGCVSSVRDRLSGTWAKKKELVKIYESGLSEYNSAVQTLEIGISYESWRRTRDDVEPTIPKFNRASERFGRAAQMANEVERQRALAMCLEAQKKADIMHDIATTVTEAADSYVNGNKEEGDELWNEYEALRDEADKLKIEDSRTLSNALGLPTD